MRGGAALHGRKGGGAMPRGKRAYRVLLWAVLAALLALATFAGWRLWRVYGDAARAAQLAREMQQTAVPAAGESAAGTDGAEMPAHACPVDFETLRRDYPAVTAWLTGCGGDIDTPVAPRGGQHLLSGPSARRDAEHAGHGVSGTAPTARPFPTTSLLFSAIIWTRAAVCSHRCCGIRSRNTLKKIPRSRCIRPAAATRPGYSARSWYRSGRTHTCMSSPLRTGWRHLWSGCARSRISSRRWNPRRETGCSHCAPVRRKQTTCAMWCARSSSRWRKEKQKSPVPGA